MKKVTLLILLVIMLFGTGIVSADPDPEKNARHIRFERVTCSDGFDEEVIVPAFDSGPGGGPAGFFQGELGGVGRPRALTITVTPPVGDPFVVEQWSQPGKGYETVDCLIQLDPFTKVELKIQRFN